MNGNTLLKQEHSRVLAVVMPITKDILTMTAISKSLVRVLALATLPFSTHSLAQGSLPPDVKAAAGQTDVVKASTKRGDRLVVAHADLPPPRPGAGPPPPPPHDERYGFGHPHLIHELAAMEVAIGIRSHQIDAWRDFTDAMLATVPPPQNPSAEAPEPKPEPFSRVLKLATDAIERGRNAERLVKAVTALRALLTQEQLERIALNEARLRPPPGQHFKIDKCEAPSAQKRDTDQPAPIPAPPR